MCKCLVTHFRQHVRAGETLATYLDDQKTKSNPVTKAQKTAWNLVMESQNPGGAVQHQIITYKFASIQRKK